MKYAAAFHPLYAYRKKRFNCAMAATGQYASQMQHSSIWNRHQDRNQPIAAIPGKSRTTWGSWSGRPGSNPRRPAWESHCNRRHVLSLIDIRHPKLQLTSRDAPQHLEMGRWRSESSPEKADPVR